MRTVARKKWVKIFLPVLAGMFLLLLCYWISLFIQPLHPDTDGDGAMFLSSLVYFIAVPFTAFLFLPQWLIVVPVWNKMISLNKNRLLSVFVLTIGFTVVSAGLLGYLIWRKAFGLRDLYFSMLISASVALFYFAGNLTTLHFLDKPDISDGNFDDDELE